MVASVCGVVVSIMLEWHPFQFTAADPLEWHLRGPAAPSFIAAKVWPYTGGWWAVEVCGTRIHHGFRDAEAGKAHAEAVLGLRRPA